MRIILFAVLSLISSSSNGQHRSQPTALRYDYDFFHINFGEGVENWIPLRFAIARDCSSEDMFCYRSEGGAAILAVVVPKRCAKPRVGQYFVSGEYSNRVNGRVRSRFGTAFVLSSPDRPGDAYLYTPKTGIIAFYHKLHSDAASMLLGMKRVDAASVKASSLLEMVRSPDSPALAQCIKG